MVALFANSKVPDQTPHSAVSDLGLHCLPNTLLGISRLQWVKIMFALIGISLGQYQGIPASLARWLSWMLV